MDIAELHHEISVTPASRDIEHCAHLTRDFKCRVQRWRGVVQDVTPRQQRGLFDRPRRVLRRQQERPACGRAGIVWIVDIGARRRGGLRALWRKAAITVQKPWRRLGTRERPVRLIPPAIDPLYKKFHGRLFIDPVALIAQPTREPAQLQFGQVFF